MAWVGEKDVQMGGGDGVQEIHPTFIFLIRRNWRKAHARRVEVFGPRNYGSGGRGVCVEDDVIKERRHGLHHRIS